MSSKRSSIWQYFSITNTRDVTAKCNKCAAVISRGGKEPKNFTNAALTNHLKNHHKTEWKEYDQKVVTRCISPWNLFNIRIWGMGKRREGGVG